MNKLEAFESAQNAIRSLDFQGHSLRDDAIYRHFQTRNSFGLDPNTPIHRIFQREFFKKDISEGYLTLPEARASVWNDPLENPLAAVYDLDIVTGSGIHLGSLVSSFHALCWTHRMQPRSSDWSSFSHGKESIRITTTAGKLMDRLMSVSDPQYMFQAWLITVDYEDPTTIQAMQNPAEVYSRMDGQGGLLALSAAVVRTKNTDEDEVRLLFDSSFAPASAIRTVVDGRVVLRVPFNWDGFIDHTEGDPYYVGT